MTSIRLDPIIYVLIRGLRHSCTTVIKVIVPFLFIAALTLLVTAKLLVWLALPVLPEALFRLGSVMLLSTLALLCFAGLLLTAKIVIHSACQYFSSTQRIRRKVLFIQGKQKRIDRLLFFRKLHINYFHAQHKKQLANANDRQHIRSLSKAIHRELIARKTNLPSASFKQLQQEHARCRISEDSEALLKLQQKIVEMARS